MIMYFTRHLDCKRYKSFSVSLYECRDEESKLYVVLLEYNGDCEGDSMYLLNTRDYENASHFFTILTGNILSSNDEIND